MALCPAAIAAFVFMLDTAVKQSVEERVGAEEERSVCKNRIVIRKVYNRGAAWNLLDGHPSLVRRISAVLVGFVLCCDAVLLLKNGSWARKAGMMLFTGGALSNVSERVLKGYVTDYIGFRVKWPSLSKITFNLGDFAIFIGLALAGFSRR